MAERYNYLGTSQLGYFAYADLDTGHMLIADPGGSYGMRAVEEGLPVPPGDGRWAAASDPPSPPPPPVSASKSSSSDDSKDGDQS